MSERSDGLDLDALERFSDDGTCSRCGGPRAQHWGCDCEASPLCERCSLQVVPRLIERLRAAEKRAEEALALIARRDAEWAERLAAAERRAQEAEAARDGARRDIARLTATACADVELATVEAQELRHEVKALRARLADVERERDTMREALEEIEANTDSRTAIQLGIQIVSMVRHRARAALQSPAGRPPREP